MSIFVCPPSAVRDTQRKSMALQTVNTLYDWRSLCMLPLFFCANFFYSYQQNVVNGMMFNIRTRSLKVGLSWTAQMVAGLLIGLLGHMGRRICLRDVVQPASRPGN